MKIIDAHAHIFPEKIAEKATESISGFYSTPMQHTGNVEQLLESGKKIGVEKYLVFSTATKAEQVESINNFILNELSEHNELIGLGTMHIEYSDFENELTRIKNVGLHGIKLHPDFQKFNFDDEKLYPMYSLLSDLNMFVLTHAGDFRYGFSHPERIAKIAKMFPKLNIIAAHFGGWSQWEIAKDYLILPNVYFDTSSTMGFTDMAIVNELLSAYDKTHIFFGTDFPMWDHKDELDNLMRTNLKDKEIEDILYNNFCDFYKGYGKI